MGHHCDHIKIEKYSLLACLKGLGLPQVYLLAKWIGIRPGHMPMKWEVSGSLEKQGNSICLCLFFSAQKQFQWWLCFRKGEDYHNTFSEMIFDYHLQTYHFKHINYKHIIPLSHSFVLITGCLSHLLLEGYC